MKIEVMKAAYKAALVDVGITNPDDPITELIAKAIVNVTASGERNPKKVMERALNVGLPHRHFMHHLLSNAI